MSTFRIHDVKVAAPVVTAGTFRVHDVSVTVAAPATAVTFRLHDFALNVSQPLAANAGADREKQPPGATLTLDGSLSTGDGPLTYEWSQTAGPTVTLSSTSAQQPTFTSPALIAGALLTFRLRVMDSTAVWSGYDSVTIAVDPQQHWRAVSGAWVPSALFAA
jgi:large repetitive protein